MRKGQGGEKEAVRDAGGGADAGEEDEVVGKEDRRGRG